ncbi:ATP-binding protein [uncultured Acetatifactor sp.]|uniref:ATP-binding protein n=1 Tax=uncultured Acetatifactor sp. TaxID=1671927 RepID=UPI00260323B5|nr:ATP-binding protein [uncultured Acetatifactor sp.]
MGEDWTGAFPVEDALEMVLMFDGTGEITYANAAARSRLGYAPEGAEDGLRGRQMGEVFPGVFRFPGSVSGIPEGEERPHLVMYRRNRTCFPVEARFLRDPDRGIFVCMANDILEQEHLGREIEQVREEARQAARVKSEFVANVTHELRTPVNGILGNVRELLGGPLEEGRTEKALRLIERCCGDMNKIIDNILDFSKLEAGKFTLELRKFHFRNMLDYVKAQHISRITEKGLDFFLTVSPQVPEYVVGDELRIVQILNNLLSNALKFTAVGKITVQALLTARVGDKAEIFFIVSDTGIGIAEEDRDKLFQSFSQVDASISRKYGGTGLGLNICRQLVELMGGGIDVESRKGGGSSFSFSIWVEDCGEETAPSAPADDVEAAFSGMAHTDADEEDGQALKRYGTPANREALKKNLSKLILSVEMENLEKAEMFMETVRQLTADAPPDIRRLALRLKMAIQKGDYEKTAAEFDRLYQSSLGQGGAARDADAASDI